MSIWNRLYNFIFMVHPIKKRGCKNLGIVTDWYGRDLIVKYDWSKPIVYRSEEFSLWEIEDDNDR